MPEKRTTIDEEVRRVGSKKIEVNRMMAIERVCPSTGCPTTSIGLVQATSTRRAQHQD
jgi:hypothetical protein